ncbi:SusC/RagA family TonB-linked outer membrane protein [Puia dinghuensis]|uniref:SusC/RagA family TonB-linked outer membrane protein n=1 Tax=Puia dinghuensis TaxID=1792502 RepID=A0A8J2UEA1_9BACT|nr:TonB-dependent receptor [Puia dinghuensis]GGB04457.1 SusC/RagA family TonB-linked outer membrane protein [Puia dinghuensis]
MRRFLFFLCCFALLIDQVTAQNHTITGTVTDANGVPVAGASVSVKGTNRGTSTGTDGTFTVTAPSTAKTLVISAVNFATQEVDVSGKTTVGTIQMKPGTQQNLNEVVVVAYGTQKKTNVTGSVQTVSGTLVADKPFTSVDKELQGAVAGLQASSTSGAPGSATDIRIRGIGSIYGSASPLWVIDGVVATIADLSVNTTTANPLSTLNPDDIESITILKDAVSTAPYGSRGANGVILVTTKKGKAGKSKINVVAEVGQNSRAFDPSNKPLTTPQYQQVLRESIINAQFATNNAQADALITNPNFIGFPASWTKYNTNWLDAVSQTGNQTQLNMSLSGGSDKTTVYASAGYFNQKGTSIASDFQRFSGSLAVTHKASDRFTLTADINASNTAQHTPANGGAFANPVLASFFLMPWYTPRNPNGSFRYGASDTLGEFGLNGGIFNPIVQAAYNVNLEQQTAVRGNATGELKILDNLKVTSRMAGEYIAIQEDQYRNPFYGDGYADGGDASSNYTRVFTYTWSNFADWRQNINKDGDVYFDLKGGIEALDTKYYTLQASGHSFPKTLALQYLANTSTPTLASAWPEENSQFSEFAIGDLNYKDRYILSGSFRRDESSVFGVNNRWGSFYSVGGSWNINEEQFMKQQNLFNLLKLRASYGQTGNANGFGRYTALPTYGGTYSYQAVTYGGNYSGQPGLVPNNVGDSNLTWEKNNSFNIGLDFAVLKNRIDGTIEYYHRETTSLLSPVPFSLTSGFSSQNENIGSVVNKGIEVTINARPVVTRDFTWQIGFNIAHNINRVTALYQNKPIPFGDFNYTVGHDLQEFYLQQWAGVNTQTGAPQWYTDGTKKQITGGYDSAGLALNHSASPSVYGGLTNTFTYKGLSLDFQFYYNFGNYIFDSWYNYYNSDGQYYGVLNQFTTQLNAWKKPGDKTDVPQLLIGGNNLSNSPSTRWLYKGDFIRLRNLQLSYNLPADLMKKAKLGSISIYIRGTNLLTFGTDKNLPFDPESGINSTTNLEVLIPKTFAGGIKVGF